MQSISELPRTAGNPKMRIHWNLVNGSDGYNSMTLVGGFNLFRFAAGNRFMLDCKCISCSCSHCSAVYLSYYSCPTPHDIRAKPSSQDSSEDATSWATMAAPLSTWPEEKPSCSEKTLESWTPPSCSASTPLVSASHVLESSASPPPPSDF